MARPRAHTKDSLVHAAMMQFWHHGYGATSMNDLVKATGVSKHGIYSDVGGKLELYLLAFQAYQASIVSAAFEQVERDGAGLGEIASYFEAQIALAEKSGLPGPGCLVANAMTETAPHIADVAEQVAHHNARLTAGFRGALANEAKHLPGADLDQLADFLTTSAQGLWSMSRTVETSAPLCAHVATLLDLIKRKLTP